LVSFRSGKKDVPQGLMLAAARKANAFSLVYGPTKSRTLIQNMSFATACEIVTPPKL